MKFFICLMIGLSTFNGVFAQFKADTKLDSISYAIGWDVGNNLTKSGVELNLDQISLGLQAAMKEEGALTEGQVQQLLEEFRDIVKEKMDSAMKEKAAANREAGEKFLQENASKEGVVSLPSGLQYKVINEGEGTSPLKTDRVEVHYEGRLLDGKVFDSSYRRGESITFGVTQVIKGWTEALQLMKPGAKWQVYIPADLGYGDRGAGRDIPPGATLIFDVELLSIQ